MILCIYNLLILYECLFEVFFFFFFLIPSNLKSWIPNFLRELYLFIYPNKQTKLCPYERSTLTITSHKQTLLCQARLTYSKAISNTPNSTPKNKKESCPEAQQQPHTFQTLILKFTPKKTHTLQEKGQLMSFFFFFFLLLGGQSKGVNEYY